MTTTIRYPEVTVRLVGEDGDAFAILGRTVAAMRRAGVPKDAIDAYRAEATSGDYNHLLGTTMEWVTTDPDEDEPDGWCDVCDNPTHECICGGGDDD